MSLELDSLHLSLLDGNIHRREAFVCGEPSLEEYLARQAGQDHKRGAATPYVLTAPDTPTDIIGYFTLSNLAVELEGLPRETQKRLARYPEVPALLIGRLAVSTAHQGQGYGGELLRRALIRCLEASDVAAASLVVVDALHSTAASFYIRHGFQPFEDRDDYPKRLYIPLSLVRKAFQAR